MQIDPTAPDLSAFPAFADVAAKEAVLRPGDIIFFPVSLILRSFVFGGSAVWGVPWLPACQSL